MVGLCPLICRTRHHEEHRHTPEIKQELNPRALEEPYFKAVEPPLEPPDCDNPIHCPAPEPCIVHDGRIWKERRRIRKDKNARPPPPLMKRHSISTPAEATMLADSAPEKTLLKLLEEKDMTSVAFVPR